MSNRDEYMPGPATGAEVRQDADRSLASVGPVKLSTVGTPTAHISETRVTRADAPNLLDRFLAGEPLGRIVAGEAMRFGWPRLNTEYAKRFGIEPHSAANAKS
ncbi:hypothetical protein PTE30175_04098 [Pandoraea terrae]|uniref:Uncharacterized protein n=1 Tax=Pandoraea terrae TaxID=1537710 RepID=A0A5E4XZ95_9BURK|nr:hypothetical protein [Pandoraea terrae]VVE41779.1 hypothetical protein PTE30175_04098 [Pandoraea terrae]